VLGTGSREAQSLRGTSPRATVALGFIPNKEINALRNLKVATICVSTGASLHSLEVLQKS